MRTRPLDPRLPGSRSPTPPIPPLCSLSMRKERALRARVCLYLLLRNARQPTIGTCGMWKGGHGGRTKKVGW
jgi:hypothetical protein